MEWGVGKDWGIRTVQFWTFEGAADDGNDDAVVAGWDWAEGEAVAEEGFHAV
jgi:hypothetical protein